MLGSVYSGMPSISISALVVVVTTASSTLAASTTAPSPTAFMYHNNRNPAYGTMAAMGPTPGTQL